MEPRLSFKWRDSRGFICKTLPARLQRREMAVVA
jgi:hypothetical protein